MGPHGEKLRTPWAGLLSWKGVEGPQILEPSRESRMSKPVLDFVIKWNSVKLLGCWSHPETRNCQDCWILMSLLVFLALQVGVSVGSETHTVVLSR